MPTYPLAFPAQTINTENLRLEFQQAPMLSPYTGHQQTVNNFSQWRLSFTWPRMSHDKAEVVQGWLDSLQGQVGTFTYRPKGSRTSSLTGKTLAGQAFSYGTTISVAGFPANSATTLRIGQYFQVGSQLLRVASASALANAAGQATIEFTPALRSNYAAGTVVNFANPAGLFRLTNSTTPSFTLDPDRMPEFGTVEAVEAR